MDGTIEAATEVMIRYGREQYEDAAVYHAVAVYVAAIGAVPAGAWGELPWSRRWRERWEKGLDHRVREAHLMAEHTGEHAAAVLRAAADYTDTDLRVGLNFDLQNKYLGPYLATYSGRPSGTALYRPGVPGPAPVFGGSAVFRPPDGVQEFRELNAERLPGAPGKCTVSNPTGIDLSSGVCGDSLDDFVARYGADLLCAEHVAAHFGSGASRPFTDHILPAWRCVPGIIRNRAELLYQAVNTYGECAREMKHDIDLVRDRWSSPGAARNWYLQAMSHHGYLSEIAGELKWFASQGITAADLLEGMRNRYAEYGHQRAIQIIELAKAAIHATTDVLGGIGDCRSDPVKALANALDGLSDLLLREQSNRHEQAIGLISIDEQRRNEQGDPGTLAHDTVPFPEHDQTLWGDGREWIPNQGGGAVR